MPYHLATPACYQSDRGKKPQVLVDFSAKLKPFGVQLYHFCRNVKELVFES
jgi:hypothetical protein